MQQQEKIKHFIEKIWQWYAKNKRRLPWRDLRISDDAQRAYLILVSEVMLQQTQVNRVQVLFPRFLQKFPTIHDLAKASNREVLIAWRGMGYNGRALRLRDAARTIVDGVALRGSLRLAPQGDNNNLQRVMVRKNFLRVTPCSFPSSMQELQQIPGIGPYTAAAIRNFAFGIPTPCVDVNIERILWRVFGARTNKVGEKAWEVLRVALVPPFPGPFPRARPSPPQGGGEGGGGKAAAWHSALMDFGSLVCTKRSPRCAECPLSHGICKSAFRVPSLDSARDDTRREPGRIIAGRFVPNRIIRGKIVDLLRDHPQGLTPARIGRTVCGDWSQRQQPWLRDILAKLRREKLVEERSGKRCALPERTA